MNKDPKIEKISKNSSIKVVKNRSEKTTEQIKFRFTGKRVGFNISENKLQVDRNNTKKAKLKTSFIEF